MRFFIFALAIAGALVIAPTVTAADRNCLTAETRSVLDRLEAAVGRVRVVSTCRPGAVIAGTKRPSQHRYGKAVDLVAPKHKKRAAVAFLRKHARGVTMVYRRSAHIHFDTGPYHRFACGGCKTRGVRVAKRNGRHVPAPVSHDRHRVI